MTEHICTVTEIIEDLPRLNGQTITVRGILAIRRENHSISDFPAGKRDFKSSLWVYFHHASLGTRERDLPDFDGRPVIATGILDIARKGHMSVFSGSLTIRSLTFDEPKVA